MHLGFILPASRSRMCLLGECLDAVLDETGLRSKEAGGPISKPVTSPWSHLTTLYPNMCIISQQSRVHRMTQTNTVNDDSLDTRSSSVVVGFIYPCLLGIITVIFINTSLPCRHPLLLKIQTLQCASMGHCQ